MELRMLTSGIGEQQRRLAHQHLEKMAAGLKGMVGGAGWKAEEHDVLLEEDAKWNYMETVMQGDESGCPGDKAIAVVSEPSSPALSGHQFGRHRTLRRMLGVVVGKNT
jgi:hypothetical protein